MINSFTHTCYVRYVGTGMACSLMCLLRFSKSPSGNAVTQRQNSLRLYDLFVESLLLCLAVLLGTLLLGHAGGLGGAWVGVEGRHLGVRLTLLLDGRDAEFLLTLVP